MTYSGYTTRTVATRNQSGREGQKITTIVLHHMASTNLEGTLHMWTAETRVGSANYAIGNEGQIVGVVPEGLRSWSLGSTSDGGKGAAFDRHSVTFEIENQSLGGSWPVSHAAHEATAKVVSDLCKRYGIACNRTQILGHREVWTRYHASYPTACPGGLDMDWIVARAKQLLGKGGTPGTTTSGTGAVRPDPETGGHNASAWSTRAIQAALIKLRYDLGPTGADDAYGVKTTAAVHKFEVDQKLSVDVGIAGPEVVGRLKKLTGSPAPKKTKAPKYPLPRGSYFGPKLPLSNLKSVSGYYSHSGDFKRWQTRMKDRGWIINPDGLYGPQSAEVAGAFQKEKGLKVDRLIGPKTWTAAWTRPVT